MGENTIVGINDEKPTNNNAYTYCIAVDPDVPLVTIYNTSNAMTNAEQKFKNGSPLTEKIRFGNEKLIEKDNWTWQKCHSIVNNAFSAAEKLRVNDVGLIIDMAIDSSTGRILDIEFTFRNDKGFATIPISVYRAIELELKDKVWFTLTDTGKSLNFVKRLWRQEVK